MGISNLENWSKKKTLNKQGEIQLMIAVLVY